MCEEDPFSQIRSHNRELYVTLKGDYLVIVADLLGNEKILIISLKEILGKRDLQLH